MNTVSTIYINGKEAENSLKGLTSLANRLAAELKKAELGSEAFAKKAEEWRKVTAIIDDQKLALKEYINTYGKTGPAEKSLTRLREKHHELVKDLDNLEVGTKDWLTQLNKVKDSEANLNKINSQIKDTGKATDLLGSTVAKVGGLMATAFAADKIIDAGRSIGTAVVTYQNAASTLSAITGVTGDALDSLKGRASELTTIVVGSGKEITNSASDILTAMKLVGSAKSELLKSAEGMEIVTRSSIILARAAGQDVPSAVTDLTTVMNQFEATASESERIINALAAGAKEGAAEIPDISAAFKEFGAGAKSANISVEESVALVETLGDKMIKGGEAGTKLRNILLTIKAPEGLDKEARRQLEAHGVSFDVLRDKSKSLGERLTELAKIQGDANALVQVFGKENVTAGEILLQNITRFKDLTRAVTGTNEATKQAAIMTDNLGGDMKRLDDEIAKATTGLGNRLAPIMRSTVQGFTDLLRGIKDNWETIVVWTKAIVTSGIAVGSYYATVRVIPVLLDLWAKRQIVLSAVTSAWGTIMNLVTGQISLATIAQRAWNLVLSLNPIGLVISAVATLTTAYLLFTKTVTDSVRAQRLINEVNAEAARSVVEQKIQLEQLLKVAKDETKSKAERIAAIKKLNELSPEYLGNLTLETIKTDGATTAVNNYVAALEKKAKSEAALQKRTELEKQLIDLNSGKTDTAPSFLQSAGNTILSANNPILFEVNQVKTSVNNASEARQGIQKEIDALNKYVETNKIDFAPATTKLNNSTPGATTKDQEKADKAAERILNREEVKLQKLRDLTNQYQNDIDQLNSQHDASEIIRIKEKYDKQISLAEKLLLSKDFKIRKEAAELITIFEKEKDAEIQIIYKNHFNTLEKELERHLDEQNLRHLTADERAYQQIFDKYNKEIILAKELEKNFATATEQQRQKAHLLRLQLEKTRDNEINEAKSIRFAEQLLKDEDATKQFVANMEELKKGYTALINETNVKPVKLVAGDEEQLNIQKQQIQDKADAEIRIIEAKFKEEEAKQIGYDERIIELEKKKTATIKQIRDNANTEKLKADKEFVNKSIQDYQRLAGAIGDAFSALGDIIGKQTKQAAALQKVAALAKIAIDTAQAISGIVAAAASTSITPVDLAIKIASGTAVVLANIASAKRIITEAPTVEQKFDGGYHTVRGQQDNQTYKARYIGQPTTGMLPPTPSLVLASERGPEYFVSNEALSRPDVSWHVRAIENLVSYSRPVRQFADGGFNDVSSTAPVAPSPILPSELLGAINLLNALLSQGIKAEAIIGYPQIRDLNDEFARIAKIQG